MILINLLPHREEKRKQRKQAFFVGMGFSALLGVLVCVVWLGAIEHLNALQQARNLFLESEVQRLNTQIKDIASLRQDIDSLKARQRSVENLQTDRNTPVRLLSELTRRVPEGIYLTGVKQEALLVNLTGVAQSNERVSELLRSFGESPWMENPQLVEIQSVVMQTGAKETRRLFNFSMRVSLKPPVDEDSKRTTGKPQAKKPA